MTTRLSPQPIAPVGWPDAPGLWLALPVQPAPVRLPSSGEGQGSRTPGPRAVVILPPPDGGQKDHEQGMQGTESLARRRRAQPREPMLQPVALDGRPVTSWSWPTRGLWGPGEDAQLWAAWLFLRRGLVAQAVVARGRVIRCGRMSWTAIARTLPGRTPAACRARFARIYARPDRSRWARHERRALGDLRDRWPTSVVRVAACLPGRSSGDVARFIETGKGWS